MEHFVSSRPIDSRPQTEKRWRQLWPIAFVNVCVVALIYVLIWPATPDKSLELWFYPLAFVVAPITSAIVGSVLSESSQSRYFSYLLPPFCAMAAALALIWSVPFLTIDNRRAFWWGCVLAWTAGAWHLFRRGGTASRLVEFLLTLAGVFVLLLLFSNPLRIDT